MERSEQAVFGLLRPDGHYQAVRGVIEWSENRIVGLAVDECSAWRPSRGVNTHFVYLTDIQVIPWTAGALQANAEHWIVDSGQVRRKEVLGMVRVANRL